MEIRAAILSFELAKGLQGANEVCASPDFANVCASCFTRNLGLFVANDFDLPFGDRCAVYAGVENVTNEGFGLRELFGQLENLGVVN